MQSFRDHIKFLQEKALQMRTQTLKIINHAQIGSTGSAISALDILVALYYGKLYDRPLMTYDIKKPGWEEQDYFVLSKGHACPAWYAILADLGFFDENELEHFSRIGSLLQNHPVKKIPGVIIGAGSAGHGFSGAMGLAMALKLDHQKNHVFCLLGDGELQAGQVWETATSAAHYKLDNFIAIIDDNGLQGDTLTRGVMNVDSVTDKFEAFGWKTIPVRNGHDFEELLSALERALEVQRRPVVLIASTVSGKGVDLIENKPFYHNVALSDQELAAALDQLTINN